MFRKPSTVALVVFAALSSLSMPGCGNQAEPVKQDTATKETGSGGKAQSVLKAVSVDLGSGVNLEMVLIPAGEFIMGSPELDDAKQHRVRIAKPFYLGKYQVTQEQWDAVMGGNPSYFRGPKSPVETVSWDDCQQFLAKLNAKVGGQSGKFVLPTEAQWEYACRAGSTTKYCFGDNDSGLGEYAWYNENSGGKTHPVGEKKPNAWGLYDMHGNVLELCRDWYGNYVAESVTDPSGPTTGSDRVARGGSSFLAGFCRSAYRHYYEPGDRSNHLGLRVSSVPPDNAKAEAKTDTKP